jgi:hypothetical protein
MPISVKVDTRDLEKAFSKIHRQMPRVTARAINETARFAKSNSEKEVAKELRLPLKIVRKRLDVKGEVKEDRTKLSRAHRGRLAATLSVYVRGIPVGQIASKPTKRQNRRPGVKAKAGRLYRGAFYAPGAAPHGFVFKRRPSGQLMMPKVGVRQLLAGRFYKYTIGRPGLTEFRKRWQRLAQFELSKIST